MSSSPERKKNTFTKFAWHGVMLYKIGYKIGSPSRRLSVRKDTAPHVLHGMRKALYCLTYFVENSPVDYTSCSQAASTRRCEPDKFKTKTAARIYESRVLLRLISAVARETKLRNQPFLGKRHLLFQEHETKLIKKCLLWPRFICISFRTSKSFEFRSPGVTKKKRHATPLF